MIKCMYAHDENDEACKNCDGMTVTFEGVHGISESYPATECGGYVAETTENQKDISLDEIDGATVGESFGEDIPWENVKQEDIEKMAVDGSVTKETKETVNNNTIEKTKADTGKNNIEIKEITAMSGISVELNGVWYKFEYTESRTVDPTKDIAKQKDNLWTEVFEQVDTALKDTKEAIGIKE